MQPFIKWAGGKRWLAHELQKWVPDSFNTYFEPFLGGAAAFFHLQPDTAILSDSNEELIATYRAVRDAPSEIVARLSEHQRQHNNEYYYFIRGSTPTHRYDLAARFLYLNRTCWNGLYRVNLKGEFNVPRGTKNQIIAADEDFLDISKCLQNCEILSSDFENIIDRSDEGDLVYVDPPYTVKHNMNGFIKYNQSIFLWSDQVRLRDACLRAQKRGVTVIISNADHESIRELYACAGKLSSVERASVIAGKASARQSTTELLAVLGPIA